MTIVTLINLARRYKISSFFSFSSLQSSFIIMPKRPPPASSNTTEQNEIKLTDLMPVEPAPLTAPTPDQIQWIANKGSYYPFSEATGSDVVEFRLHGTVMDSVFLKGGLTSYSHSVCLDLSDEDVELLKSYVYKIPNYDPDTYRWPLQVNTAKFTCKENVSQPFTDVWEIDDEKLIRNEDLRAPISYERVKKGTPVLVEYTIVGYNGKAATKEDSNTFKDRKSVV